MVGVPIYSTAWMTWGDSRGTRAIAVRDSPGAVSESASASDAGDRRTRLQLEFQMTKTPNDFWYATDEVIVLVMPKTSSGKLSHEDHIQALQDALADASER